MRAISPNHLQTYQAAAAGRCNVLDLYIWDRDLAAAAVADVAILEVALRNAMNEALTRPAGCPDWYTVNIGLDNRSLAAVAKAWGEVPAARRSPGRVVAQFMFGFWRSVQRPVATYARDRARPPWTTRICGAPSSAEPSPAGLP